MKKGRKVDFKRKCIPNDPGTCSTSPPVDLSWKPFDLSTWLALSILRQAQDIARARHRRLGDPSQRAGP